MATDFVPVLNQLFQQFDVVFSPINFPPILGVEWTPILRQPVKP